MSVAPAIVLSTYTKISFSKFARGSQRQRVIDRRQRHHGEAFVLALQYEGNLTGSFWSFKE